MARINTRFVSNQLYYVVKAGESHTFPTTICHLSYYNLTKGDTYIIETEYNLGYCKIGDRHFKLITFIPLTPSTIVH